jgi:alpha-D-ribose 1-methylphosphonate 5-phosphate C-P lyase
MPEEADLIELTEQQIRALQDAGTVPLRMMDPRTHETFVLLRVDEYERLAADEYDDSPWTREELEAIAWEAGKEIGWEDEDMDSYDRLPEKP